MSDETVLPIPNIKLQQHLFAIANPKVDPQAKEEAKKELLKGVEADGEQGVRSTKEVNDVTRELIASA